MDGRVSVQVGDVEGEPAEPPTLSVAVPDWKPGDTIHTRGKALRVVALRDDDADSPPVLVVEDTKPPDCTAFS